MLEVHGSTHYAYISGWYEIFVNVFPLDSGLEKLLLLPELAELVHHDPFHPAFDLGSAQGFLFCQFTHSHFYAEVMIKLFELSKNRNQEYPNSFHG